jgi:hypothetical protein
VPVDTVNASVVAPSVDTVAGNVVISATHNGLVETIIDVNETDHVPTVTVEID